MDDKLASTALAALGHEARLKLFRLLVRAGPDGMNIGELGRLLGLPASTLSHHLGALVTAGLVTQEKRGREVINRVEFLRMSGLLRYIEAECCQGVASEPGEVA